MRSAALRSAQVRIAVCVLLSGSSVSHAQNASPPEFEVASVRQSVPSKSDLIDINLGTIQNSVVTLSNATLGECLQFAYGLVSEEQISGPDWIKSRAVRFDITAKALPGVEGEQIRAMMQTLLAERLRVTLHHEPKTVSYLALTVDKRGSRLHPARAGGVRRLAVMGRIASPEMTMSTLAKLLSRFERQLVVDQTGLSGSYEMQLEWTPENGGQAAAAQEGRSLFSAVQEQLGLRLESRKGPLDAVVIDRAEKIPVEN